MVVVVALDWSKRLYGIINQGRMVTGWLRCLSTLESFRVSLLVRDINFPRTSLASSGEKERGFLTFISYLFNSLGEYN